MYFLRSDTEGSNSGNPWIIENRVTKESMEFVRLNEIEKSQFGYRISAMGKQLNMILYKKDY